MTLSTMIVRFSLVAFTTGTIALGTTFGIEPKKVIKPITGFPGSQPPMSSPIPFPPITPTSPPASPVPMTPAPTAPVMVPSTPKLGVVGNTKATGGFWIHEILPNSPAADLGLESGDLILTVNGTLIKSNATIVNALADAQTLNNGHITLIVQDGRGAGLVQIDGDISAEGPIATFAPGAAGAPKKLSIKNVKKQLVKKN